MKKILLFLVLTIWFSFVYAGIIQNNEAKIIALNWINSQGGVYLEMDDIGMVYSKIEDEVPIFYLVSFKPAGWVIVSGSDATEPVLGYSVSTQFNIETMPPQVKGWMGGIAGEIETAIKNKLVPSPDIRQKWQTYSGKLIEKKKLKSLQYVQAGPLLSTIWNQGRYYNEMCPADATSSTGNGYVWLGCVATAMAQVMKFWEYPATGMGNHSYVHPVYGTQSADFGNSTYNWSAMPNNVTSLNTEVQKIGYHCAVSVDMNFGPAASGAWLSSDVFIDNFRYNSTVFESDKDRWDDSEWKAQLKRDIDAGRPVVYSGYNSAKTSGHAFVCDGYTGDYFHFNWGWGGAYNGNFLLSALTPGSSNFSTDQAALFSIEPIYPASISIPYIEGFESGAPVGLSLMGVNNISTSQSHTGTHSLQLGKESIVSYSTNAASLCFVVPTDAELNFWVKRYTPEISTFNQQKAYIFPQYGNTPLLKIYDGDFNDADWVSYNVNLSAYTGQIVRLLFLQDVQDLTGKQQCMYIDDISISGVSFNIAPYIPSNPNPPHLTDYVILNPVLRWSGGDPNGDDLIYKVYFGTSNTPPLVGSVFTNSYSPPALSHTTTYFWKIVSDDGSLTTEGPLWSFTTKGIPPTLSNCGVTNLTSNSMTVCGKILNYNNTTVTSRGICWSQDQNPSLPSSNYMEAPEPTDQFSCNISGMTPFKKYYYRAFAISNQGIGYSETLNLTTLPDLPVVTVEGVGNILRSTASVTGKVHTINDSSIISRGVVWSTVPDFNPQLGHIVSETGNWKDTGNFIFNLVNLPGPGNIFFRVFAVNSVGIAYSGESMFTTPNIAPFVDLDINNSRGAGGSDFIGSCTEQLPGGVICDIDVAISDLDGDTIKQVMIQIINAFDLGFEYLTVLSGNNKLVVAGNGTGQLLLTSATNLTYNEWKEALRSIEYRNNLDSPHPEIIRQIQVKVSDGFDISNIATAFMRVYPVNDPPVVQILPSLNTPPVFGSSVNVMPGTWADLLDGGEGAFSYSYSWQMKYDGGEIINLSHDGQMNLPIGDSLCGSMIRVLEKVTDQNSGGTNQVTNQAESQWYQVGKISQSIILDPVPVHNFAEGFFKLGGSSTSGLPIYFSVPQNSHISITNDTVHIINAGTMVISGIQPGNACYHPSEKFYKIVNIVKSQQEIICENSIDAKFHQRWMKLPATATSGLGLVVISSDSAIAFVNNDTIYFTGTGQVSFSISQPGNQNYFPSDTAEMALTVLKGDQSITTHFPDELIYGRGSFPFSVVSSANLDVELSSSNPSVLDLAGDSIIVQGVGEVLVRATQPGNNLWNPAADIVVPLLVKKGTQEIVVEAIGEKIFNGSSFIPVSYSTSGLIVTFSVRDTSVAKVVDGKIIIKNVGETTVDFLQSGNNFWEPAYRESPLKIVKANQSITFNRIDTLIFGVRSVNLNAYSSSGLNVVFAISDQNVATISGDSLYIHNAGAAIITANQQGNNQYNQAVPVQINLVVKKASQSIVSNLPDSITNYHQLIFADVVSTSGLKVVIVSSDEKIVKVVSDSLQIMDKGKVLLYLSQSGNSNYLSTESSVSLVVKARVGVTKFENSNVSIFPNPTEGKVSLIVTGDIFYPIQVSIINSTGKTISNFVTGNPVNRIDLSNQPSGLYFIAVRNQSGNIAKKLLIAR